MKILVIEPGPDHSTIDVCNGIASGLRTLGHQVGVFALHNRIRHAEQCLMFRWEAAGSPEALKPGITEVVFHASGEIVQYALYHEVEWVLFISCGLVHDAVYTMLRRAGVPTAMVMTESPYEDDRQAEVASLVDIIWTNERTSVGDLRVANSQCFYLPHGYNPEKHHPNHGALGVQAHDVVFVGTLWQERIDLLVDVDWTGIDLGIYGSADLFDLERFPYNRSKRDRLAPFLHTGFIANEQTADLYRSAKIGINLHRTSLKLGSDQHITSAESMNPRCYEQAAIGGALLITDPREEVYEVFGPGAPIFRDAKTLEAQIHWFLDHPQEVKYRVNRLRERVQPHTLTARAEQIAEDMISTSYVFERSKT